MIIPVDTKKLCMSKHHWTSRRSHSSLHDITHYCPVTLFLMAVCIIVAGLSKLGESPEKMDSLFFSSQREVKEAYYSPDEYAQWSVTNVDEIVRRNAIIKDYQNNPQRDIVKGEAWRLATPMFLHFGILHIVFNMMWLWQFGLVLETRFRSMRFLGLVLFIAILSNTAQAFMGGTNFGGMSGVNYGLFGFLLARSKLHPDPGFILHRQTITMFLIWLVLCFTGLVGPIANTAHVVGLLCGGLIGTINAMQSGAWALLQRKRQFRGALRQSNNALHHCATCEQTELSDPDLEFYVHPSDGQEYCKNHLPK
jgi:membrane associated rhomboid family serine protease